MSMIGIMGAMPEEVDGIIAMLEEPEQKIIGMRTYTSGLLYGKRAVVAFSRWGKVAAATTVTTMIQVYGINELIFTGVAGAINPQLRIGDIVVAKRLIQYDMDARPLIPQFEIPLLGKSWFECDSQQINIVKEAISQLLDKKALHKTIREDVLERFDIANPQLLVGDIASGDRFFAANAQKAALQADLPEILCVEMEGAAVAQACYEHNIPYTIIRTISDTAEDGSHIDFEAFILNISSVYSAEIIKHLFILKQDI